jgi:hypothetical protein
MLTLFDENSGGENSIKLSYNISVPQDVRLDWVEFIWNQLLDFF